jgi:hypothetical protein
MILTERLFSGQISRRILADRIQILDMIRGLIDSVVFCLKKKFGWLFTLIEFQKFHYFVELNN